MRKGELSSRYGALVVLLLFLLGGSLLFFVPVAADASPQIQKSLSTESLNYRPILEKYSDRRWESTEDTTYSALLGTPREIESKYDDVARNSWATMDIDPFGTPHAPIIIKENNDFVTQGWLGEGTVEQPYIIEGLNINATTGESAINITNTDVHFFIKDCWLTSNSTNVIELGAVSHARIWNNTILDGERGVAAFHCDDITIYDNLFYSFGWAGVYMEDCSLSTLSNNNCTSCYIGLHVEQSEHCTVENNFVGGCNTGIDLYWDCEYITVFNNTIQDSWDGIYIYLNCHDNIIDSNNCTQIQHLAIIIGLCSENTILNNFCYLNSAGIVVVNSTAHTITGNDCGLSMEEFVGSISLRNTNHSLVTNNHVENSSMGIEMTSGSSHNEVSNNNCSIYDAGIVSWEDSPHNTITGNTCDGQGLGDIDIYTDESSNCTITENRCSGSNFNIGALLCNQIYVIDNICYESLEVSLILYECQEVFVEDNTLENGSTGIAMEWVEHSSVLNNTITNFTGSYSGLTGIHLDGVYNSSIVGNNITECNVAIFVEQSSDCNITDNSCIENFDGIVLVATNFDIIVDDNYCHLQQGYAIAIVESFNCSVIRNTCTNTNGSEGVCLLLGDAAADVSWNSFSLSTGGMDVQGNDGLITHNIIEDNELFGMTVSGIIGPNVTWNIFDHTGVNAIDDSGGTFFDYNYWFNYTGFDANGDGIGDTWHPVDGTASNNDKHPLFYQWTLPDWVENPTNQEVELGQTFSYSLSTIVLPELAPLMDWWISDTTNFQVDNGTVTNAVDLDFATYELEIRAINLYGFELSGTFTVTVVDTTIPTISGPDDLRFTLGATGHDIYWTLYDAGPDRFRISIEGVPVISGNWVSSGQIVQLNVDHLDVGVYTVVITITDVGGNIESDTVHVIVEAAPSDRIPIVPVLGLGGAAIAAIIIVVILRKKGTGE